MSDLADRNRVAILEGLAEVNNRINILTNTCRRLEVANHQLMQDILKLRQDKLTDLCKQFGSGPTT